MGTQETTRRSGWKQWTAADARRELRAWRESKRPLETFARGRGYDGSRLRWWRERLKDEAGPSRQAAAPAFVPAVVREVRVPTRLLRTEPAVAVQLPGGMVLEVTDVAVVPPDWLAAVVRALRAES
jgi:hypothetical protein